MDLAEQDRLKRIAAEKEARKADEKISIRFIR